MSKNKLYTLWGLLFILCAGLGFMPEPEGSVRFLLTALSSLFFLPPAALLYCAGKRQDRAVAMLIRNLSALSLVLTMILLILNFLAALGSDLLGQILHYILTIVSSPMICSGHWALCLFLWACLLMVSIRQLKR